MPADDGGRLDDGENQLPPGPQAGQDHPQASIPAVELRASSTDRPLENRDLVPQRQILQSKFALRDEERPSGQQQAPEQVEHGQGS